MQIQRQSEANDKMGNRPICVCLNHTCDSVQESYAGVPGTVLLICIFVCAYIRTAVVVQF